MMKIKKNDRVVVLSGRDKGKKGRVIEVLPKKNKVLVEGINMLKHFDKPNRAANKPGGIFAREAPLDISNVMVLEGDTPTRVGFQILQDGRKVRVSKRTGATLD